MSDVDIAAKALEFLFGRGQTVADYYIEVTPYSEMICFTGQDGQELYLSMSDAELEEAAILELRKQAVRIVKLG